ncbi:DUF302 domain-containing protein [Candidatus Uhrbacteria bacterium]|nr:DUF302 domain-containing protein [Candidatus Uhrbacteria bacterium]
MEYGYRKELTLPFPEAVEQVKAQLANEGFGILTEIDVKGTLKKKLNVDYENYCILGACNPPFALKALQSEREIGLLMPCNVIVYEAGGKTFVSAILPTVAMGMIDNPPLVDIAKQVEQKLKTVIDHVST